MTSPLSREEGRALRDQRSFWAESNAQVAIVRFLRSALPPSYRVISIPNGRFKADPATIARLKREGLTPGVHDLLILRNDGWFASLEVKASDGRLSPEQKEWADWLSSGGASQAVVRSLIEAEQAVLAFNVPLRARVGA
jgi:hypothetical protein